jgi:hypothetical protein
MDGDEKQTKNRRFSKTIMRSFGVKNKSPIEEIVMNDLFKTSQEIISGSYMPVADKQELA